MNWRGVLGIATTAFLLFGILGWVSSMPRPAATVSAYSAAVNPGGTESQLEAVAAPLHFGAGASSVTDGIVTDGWLTSTARATGIPIRALQAYAAAAVATETSDPACGVGWNTIAAIGFVESGHGTHGGARIDAEGHLVGAILGPSLDGIHYDAVPDTDQGTLDGDPKWDRAVGPFQFLPATWKEYGADGDGDGAKDPNQIDDVALAAAHYLCSSGGDLTTSGGWTAAIEAYNPNVDYLNEVAAQANVYSEAVE